MPGMRQTLWSLFSRKTLLAGDRNETCICEYGSLQTFRRDIAKLVEYKWAGTCRVQCPTQVCHGVTVTWSIQQRTRMSNCQKSLSLTSYNPATNQSTCTYGMMLRLGILRTPSTNTQIPSGFEDRSSELRSSRIRTNFENEAGKEVCFSIASVAEEHRLHL
jgi:hypothetical protein